MLAETAFITKNNKAPADETTDERRRYKNFIQLQPAKKFNLLFRKNN